MTATALPEVDPIPRDRWGRPMIIPIEGKKPEPYTRASTAAKATDDLNGLIGWAGKQVLKGLVARPDIYEFARTVGNNEDEIRQLADRAKEAAGSSIPAALGTAIHWWTDQLDTGRATIDQTPLDYIDLLTAYQVATEKLEVVESELFVVCDELRFAGTLDRLYRLPDGRVIVGDIKTGKWASTYGAAAVAIQCAIYSHGKRYDPKTGERSELHPDLDPDTTMLVHMPLDTTDVELHELDGELGYYGAELSRRVLNIRKARPIKPMVL